MNKNYTLKKKWNREQENQQSEILSVFVDVCKV